MKQFLILVSSDIFAYRKIQAMLIRNTRRTTTSFLKYSKISDGHFTYMLFLFGAIPSEFLFPNFDLFLLLEFSLVTAQFLVHTNVNFRRSFPSLSDSNVTRGFHSSEQSPRDSSTGIELSIDDYV